MGIWATTALGGRLDRLRSQLARIPSVELGECRFGKRITSLLRHRHWLEVEDAVVEFPQSAAMADGDDSRAPRQAAQQAVEQGLPRLVERGGRLVEELECGIRKMQHYPKLTEQAARRAVASSRIASKMSVSRSRGTLLF
jgi:hypothetical protein